MRQVSGIAVAILGLGLGWTAKADIWSFATSTSNGNYGSSKVFTSTGGVAITTFGYLNNGTTQNIYGKYTAGDATETGLGFTNEADGDHEIDNTGYIELDLNNITNGTVVSLAVASLQSGESYNLYEANTQGGTSAGGANPGGNLSLLVSNPPSDALTNSPFQFTKTAAFRYIAVEAQAADVLIGTLSTVAPEPGYYVPLLVGLSGMAVIAIRRRRSGLSQG